MKKSILFRMLFMFAVLLQFTSNLNGQHNPVSWNVSSEKTDETIYKINIEAKIESGWYVYSQVLESDMGPVATFLDFSTNSGVKLMGKADESGNRKEGMDKAFGMNVVKYLDNVTFSQTIKVEPNVQEINCIVTFMTCNGEMCLPPKDIPLKINL